ncbi:MULTISPECIES: 7-carboxy-7-deazaguanine synthase QueE [unclassified Methylophilus]|uniref:7-carboxy-7-deazaguanine synthase QueE n=1 Tax=unclassified Methylophilus TaxID=2630143 RepID=UPI0023B22C85|nr:MULTISPECIES: 7-carboxy-7-deazaguanine synthase QueE [unclassified Methylophilus]MDF0378012.1 7-carboxy-7-deazaguanine synthase QueE [Methylophilus sp. YYY-1]MDT7849381.1 7-carboxy-7-deazaguanine synthase QueE [Methylophilus sp. VKM B-3414]
MTTLKIFEIFYSLQGESSRVGLPTIFIRLTGCPLRCGYCDTEYAFKGGSNMTLDDIMQQIAAYDTRYVCVTGGEPLAQKGCIELLTRLGDAGYQVSLETSGAMDIAEVDSRVKVIMDIKTPGSGEVEKNRWENLPLLKAGDEVKWVICSREDYDWAKLMLQTRAFPVDCDQLFSPSFHEVSGETLASWILQDHLKVRMQLQLHKILWGEKQGV